MSPKSDKHEISLYNINALENRVFTRIAGVHESAQMSLADISTNSPHYFYWKSIWVVMRISILTLGIKGLIVSVNGGYKIWWFVYSNVSAYSLRGTNILSLPKPSKTTYGLNSFSYSSVKYWNSLPDHFRKTVDYSEFKRKLLVHGFS